MMKKVYIFLVTCLLIISCSEDFITLDDDKSRYVPSTFWNTYEHADQALTAAYSGLNQWSNGYTDNMGIMHFALGDDLYQTGNASGWGTWGSTNDFNITANASEVNSTWNAYYADILKCNSALEVMPEAQVAAEDPTFTVEKLNVMMGQVYFLRAFNYWNLYQYFPKDKIVIRRTVPASEAEYTLAPSPADSTFNFIVSDLRKAETLLTGYTNVTAGWAKGRVTRGAVVALLGKLYMNADMYAEAAAEFKKILPDVGDVAYGTYSLCANFRDNFTRSTENNSESVFEIQFYNNNSAAGWSNNDVHRLFIDFTLNRTSWSAMWFNLAIPIFKLDEFESWTENIGGIDSTIYDYRTYATFWGVPGGAHFTDQYGVEKDYIAQGWADEYLIGQKGALGLRKYAPDKASEIPAGLDVAWSDVNLRIIRLGDIYLRYAECLAQTNPSNVTSGDVNSAVYWIDKIRERANNVAVDQVQLITTRTGVRGQLPNTTDLMAAKSWSLMDVIEHERYCEGYCEGWRKEDLLRWKKDINYVKYKNFWTGYQSLILPIPQTEIDRNPNYQ